MVAKAVGLLLLLLLPLLLRSCSISSSTAVTSYRLSTARNCSLSIRAY